LKHPFSKLNTVKSILSELVFKKCGKQERAPGVTIEEIKNKTEGKLIVEGDIPEMMF
jgi:3-oxoacid CoA-transferase subunit B